jgi:choice-of-anchor A domain-containing protein
LSTLVGQLVALSANSVVAAKDLNNVAFNAVPDASGRAVFEVSTAALESYRNMTVNLNGADTVVINVSGTSLTRTGNFNAGADVNRHVIWNFYEATSLDFGFWHGSVLALNAAVSNFTPIEGTLVAASFNGGGELHDYGFAGRLPSADPVAVPEPASLALMAVGLAGLAAVRRRRA